MRAAVRRDASTNNSTISFSSWSASAISESFLQWQIVVSIGGRGKGSPKVASILDNSPVYYAATTLYLYYKIYCEAAWADKPEWIEANNLAF